LRLEDIDEEIRRRITAGEQIESITLKPPIRIAQAIKIRRAVPKVIERAFNLTTTLNDNSKYIRK
jgi:hypothetical protein